MAISSDRAAMGPADRRAALKSRFLQIRARTLELAAPLSAEDQALQSMPDASPTKWHLAHTTWFFERFVLDTSVERFDPSYDYLFNSYYEAVGARHPRSERGMLSRPSRNEIIAYRGAVDRAITSLLADCGERALRLIELGLNHEQQHQELMLMDIKHLFSLNPLTPVYAAFPPAAVREAPPLNWIPFGGGLLEIGHDGEGFAFDNEGPRHKVWLEPFRLANRLVTNGDYLEFIEEGGYQRPEFWLSDGWAKVREEDWQAPLYWRRDGGEWRVFTLAGLQPVNLSAPVCHVSYYEADAFARWADKRLPTEAEWEIAAGSQLASGNLAESGYFHPQAAKGDGLAQMIGDAWEWTQSPYTPYPRYRPAEGALGEYNGKFMVNQFVLRGGSAATPADHIRTTYRNFFPPHARWAFSGVRLADDA